MRDNECVEFLQWCLPQLRMRWAGFRKVRKQVCKRISRRMNELGLPDPHAYKAYIGTHPDEWEILDSMCRITISRFYRDRGAFDTIRSSVLPELAVAASNRGEDTVHSWSVGCGSGEEAYTLQILWKLCITPMDSNYPRLRITATNTEAHLLNRAQRGYFLKSSLKDMPEDLVQKAFDKVKEGFVIRKPFMEDIDFIEQDIRQRMPGGPFHLVLCRNLVFTYFEESLQIELLEKIVEKLLPGGFLVVGVHERLPMSDDRTVRLRYRPCIYQKSPR